ncbi:PAN domain-containing protein [Mesorhizobium sp. M0220]
MHGTVSATVGVPLESCKEFCSTRSGCLGFDYSSSDQICRLFASVGGASQNQQYIAGTRSLVTGYLPPANPPVAAQTKGPPEAKKQESSTSPKSRAPAPVVHAKPRREKKRETAKPRSAAKPTPVSPAPTPLAPAARQSKFRICNNHFGTFSVPASRRCPVSGPGSF